jgi:hypothetical protein
MLKANDGPKIITDVFGGIFNGINGNSYISGVRLIAEPEKPGQEPPVWVRFSCCFKGKSGVAGIEERACRNIIKDFRGLSQLQRKHDENLLRVKFRHGGQPYEFCAMMHKDEVGIVDLREACEYAVEHLGCKLSDIAVA